MNLKELLEQKAALQQKAADLRATIEPQIAALADQLTAVDTAISALLSPDLASVRKLQEKEFGAVHITRDGYRVTETIGKTVKWSQDVLFNVFQKIQSANDNPFNYMKAEWKVGEKEYNAYPPEIKAVFAPARVVTPGLPKLEFKELEGTNV